ncbi:HdeD family acid-resistance protein [Leifsonia sp. YAF41]|uniref:HdeD family acid-resistance protein n=1 Tax=Leifsonia sp. YAF41 TaxID=3233086 RepID=UPI003F9E9677
MVNAPAATAAERRYWTVPIGRAVLALIPAAVITFNADHSPELGLVAFGAFAVLSGILVAVGSWLTLGDARARTLFLVQGIAGVVLGALALAFHSGGLGFFLYLVSVWGAVTGFLELYSGTRARGKSASARDWMSMGALTAILALVFLILPPHAVVSVGLLGAYFVVLGVYLVIGGLSLKWASTPAAATSVAKDSDIS